MWGASTRTPTVPTSRAPALCAACVALALCAACVALAQLTGSFALAQAPPAAAPEAPISSAEWTALTEPLLERIGEEEARNGLFSRDLIEPLTALGRVYQELGEHDLAVAVLDRAFYLWRFNEGLHNLDQVPLVRRLVESERAVGRFGEVAALEERLIELARRNRNDPRSAPIFREAAERELDYYERYLNGELPFTIAVNDSGGPARTAAFSVWRARRYYNEAIAALAGGGEPAYAELAALEEGLTRTYYLEARNWQPTSLDPNDWATVRRASLYGLGRSSYQRRVGYAAASAPTVYEAARALVELADWSILFSRNGTGVKGYAQAHALLVEAGAPDAAIEALFPADVPVFLPAFVASPLDAQVRAPSPGHVDFDFEIGRYGQPRKIRIVDVSGADAAARAKAVVGTIGRSRFRPSPFAETARATTYRLRYSLADGRLSPRS